MKKVKLLLINVIILTLTSLLMRTIGISFLVFISNKIGSAGIGLYQLILSIYFLGITFSASGIRLTTTRLVAEELGVGKKSSAKKAIHNCMTYSLMLSLTVSALLYLNAEYISTYWICDARTMMSLRLLSFSLPFIAMSSVLSGYFTAVRRVAKLASVQIFEQLIKISITVACLMIMMPKDIEHACMTIVIGTSIGEVSSFIVLFLVYKFDVKRYQNDNFISNNLISRMLHIALPVAFSAYVTSSMRTLQQLLIPFGLKRSGESAEMALATYGIIHGMVMPVLYFPSALLDAVSDLIVPELAECKVRDSKNRINYIVTRVFHLGLLSSILVMSIFLNYSNELGIAIYKSSNASYYIKMLAPLIPILYLDTITDGMLKGLGEQVRVMRYNIIESVISVAFIYTLLPIYAISGYIFTIFFARTLNFSLSIHRLIEIVEFKICIKGIFKAFLCIAISLSATSLIFYVIGNTFNINISSLPLHILVVIIIYVFLLRVFYCITNEDFVWFKSIFK